MAVYHHFVPNITRFNSVINGVTVLNRSLSEEIFNSFETAAYLENIFTMGSRLKFNIGVRFSSYFVNKNIFYNLEPRFLARLLISEKSSLKISFSKMHQYIHLLSNSGTGIPVDFWYPVSEKSPPEGSMQITAGYSTTLTDNFELSVESFYKRLNGLTTFKPGVSYFGTGTSFEQKIENGGKGVVYGIDFLLQKKLGRLTGWIGYTWMKNDRQFAGINNGNPFPYKYDRRNDISIVFAYRISDKIDFAATWVYGTGQALTLPVGKYYLPEAVPGSNLQNSYLQEVYIYTKKNGFRTKPYHRLDLSLNFKKKKSWGERTWNFSIYNVYNRKNPYTYFFSSESVTTATGQTNKVYLIQQSLFPFIPSVSYSIKF